jgi:hypothetical protein
VHDPGERPAEPCTGDLRSRLGRTAGVLPPYSAAASASVSAYFNTKSGRPVAVWFVGQDAVDFVFQCSLAAAPLAPVVWFDDTAGKNSATVVKVLTYGFESEGVESAECGQIGCGEGSFDHESLVLEEKF